MLPQNWPALQLFLAGNSQWILGPAGGFVGLNYPGVEIAINRLELDVTPATWRGLQIMESAACDALNQRSSSSE